MSESLNSLKETAPGMHPLHRLVFELTTTEQWYSIIREANQLYGRNNWRGQSHVRRKLQANHWAQKTVKVWFDVPDPAFASWVAVKHSVIARVQANK